MNENGKQEQEQPMTRWPAYAYLVLAFSILFAFVVLGAGGLALWDVIDSAGPLQAWFSWCATQCRKAIIVTLCLGLAFFAGAFVFLALKTKTEQGEAAGKAVVWVCRILFYPVHMIIRAVVRLAAVVLLLLAIIGGVALTYFLYASLGPYLQKAADVVAVVVGVGSAAILVSALPNYILPLVKKSMGNVEKITSGASQLYMLPEMVVNKSWPCTLDAVRKIDKEVMMLFINLLLLILLSMAAVAGFSALEAAVTDEETVELSAAPQERTSYIFLRNMPWIVGNVQSFFSSAVVFPKDATPDNLAEDGEGALSLNEHDKRFYRAVYRPLLADLARCGTLEKKVTIELSGFASTSNISSVNQQGKKIREQCSELIKRPKNLCNSDAQPDINEVFNLCVANRRANFVKEMLEGFVEEEKSQDIFKFQVKQWDSLELMQEQTNKIFFDVTGQSDNNTDKDDGKSCRDNGQYDATRGLMNRRVDVAIIETPLCMM